LVVEGRSREERETRARARARDLEERPPRLEEPFLVGDLEREGDRERREEDRERREEDREREGEREEEREEERKGDRSRSPPSLSPTLSLSSSSSLSLPLLPPLLLPALSSKLGTLKASTSKSACSPRLLARSRPEREREERLRARERWEEKVEARGVEVRVKEGGRRGPAGSLLAGGEEESGMEEGDAGGARPKETRDAEREAVASRMEVVLGRSRGERRNPSGDGW